MLLLGLATLGVCVVIFRRSGGLSLIRQFLGGDMDLIMANIDDITYFVNNLDVTWRLYYEVAALVMLAMITVVLFVILHCFVKNQALSILKAVLLLEPGAVCWFFVWDMVFIILLLWAEDHFLLPAEGLELPRPEWLRREELR